MRWYRCLHPVGPAAGMTVAWPDAYSGRRRPLGRRGTSTEGEMRWWVAAVALGAVVFVLVAEATSVAILIGRSGAIYPGVNPHPDSPAGSISPSQPNYLFGLLAAAVVVGLVMLVARVRSPRRAQ